MVISWSRPERLFFLERPLLATTRLPDNVMTRDRDLVLIVIAFLIALFAVQYIGYTAQVHEPRDSFGDIPQSPGNFAAER